MKIDAGITPSPFVEAASQARRLESIGFDCAWTFETAHNPFLQLAVAAAATQRIELGTNIAVAFARTPFLMAQSAWDIQKNSGGRFHLGIGTQVKAHVERRFSATFEHPAERVTDYIRCVRAIWNTFQTGAKPEYEGRFYQFKLINDFFNPGPIDHPDIPVYLAGVNPRMCQAAGEVADGLHVHPMHSVSYLKAVVIPAVEDGARRAGRSMKDLTLYAPVFAVSGNSQAETDASEREVRRQLAFYCSTPSYRVLLEHHGFGGLGKELSALMRQGDIKAMTKLVPDELVEQIAVIAKPADLAGELRKRYEGVLDRVSLYFPISADTSEDAWRAFVGQFREAA